MGHVRRVRAKEWGRRITHQTDAPRTLDSRLVLAVPPAFPGSNTHCAQSNCAGTLPKL